MELGAGYGVDVSSERELLVATTGGTLRSGKCLCQACTQAPMPTPGAGLGTQRSPLEPDFSLFCRLQVVTTRAGVCKMVKG